MNTCCFTSIDEAIAKNNSLKTRRRAAIDGRSIKNTAYAGLDTEILKGHEMLIMSIFF
jgi:hypothetical protein